MDASSLTSHSLRKSIAAWFRPDPWKRLVASWASRGQRPPLFLPLALLVVCTLLMRVTNIDLAVSRLFYDSTTGQWPLLEAEPWNWLYHWGVMPGLALGFAGLVVNLLSYLVPALREHRRASGFLALALLLGPGLVVNGVMKPCWGRSRPCELVQFGGEAPFIPALNVGHGEVNSSFPSGHASMGFVLMAPMFLAFRRRRHLATAFLLLGIAGGMLMGATRIVQGRHFLSDIIWSAAAVYFTCWLVAAIMQLYTLPETIHESEEEPAPILRLEPWQASDDQDQHRRAA